MKEREKERKRKDRERERENRAVSFDTPTTEVDASYKKLPSSFFLWLYSRIEQNKVTTEKIELKRSSTFIRSLTPALRGRCEARMRKE